MIEKNRKYLVHMFENSVSVRAFLPQKWGKCRTVSSRPRKMVTEDSPSPFLRYTEAAAAFNGFMGARVEMACL